MAVKLWATHEKSDESYSEGVVFHTENKAAVNAGQELCKIART